MISAKVICDSIGEHSPRLTTFLTRYPKFVHAEHCRHRTHSFCVSSSRAIPLSKTLEEVRSDELRAAPVFWGAEQKGMSPGGELSDELDPDPFVGLDGSRISRRQVVKNMWARAAIEAAVRAEKLHLFGVHKSICNRLLDPFLHVNVLVTSCEPGLLNFFGLRLDKSADPTIRALAEAMWAAWNESTPRRLKPGEWHLPFIDEDRWILSAFADHDETLNIRDGKIRISVARCARLSYTSFETGKRSTIEEDLKLYDRLITSRPIHASPAEHQATPDMQTGFHRLVWHGGGKIDFDQEGRPYPVFDDQHRHIPTGFSLEPEWKHEAFHGNLPGWIQYRKTLPGEAVAPLPEGYE